MTPTKRLSVDNLDAVLLDLDGVVTDTAALHAKAWKEMFDGFLNGYGGQQPFDIQRDYLQFVDGRPRYDGVRTFLQSREIDLPFGSPEDGERQSTICGLGNRKNSIFQRIIAEEKPMVYPGTLAFIKGLRQRGVKTAVVTSSKNGRAIIQSLGIEGLFDLVVDGIVAQREHIQGKPAPDVYLYAARRLAVSPDRSAVVEDALSGVDSAREGGFRHVIGVARHKDHASLASHGADIVVTGLGELELDDPPS